MNNEFDTSMNERDAQIERLRVKAKMMRFKKPAVKGLTLYEIWNNLVDWNEKCADVEWVTGNAGQNGVDALAEELGSLDDAYELMSDYNDLSADIESMMTDINRTGWRTYEEEAEDECDCYFDGSGQPCVKYKNTVFDNIIAVSGIGDARDYRWMGYDAYEHDYFGITPYEAGIGAQKAREELKKLTKDKLCDAMQTTFAILFNYLNIEKRYERLETAFDLLHDKYGTTLQAAREIEEQWEIMDRNRENRYGDRYRDAERKFNRLRDALPQEAWLQ